jgi:hypothetical protein
MDLNYLLNRRTNGANPFNIFGFIENHVNQESLAFGLRRMPYRYFLETAYWFAVSSVVKSNAGMRCNVCNSDYKIQVHHRTYDNHGYEHKHMNDLVVLCDYCHGLFHGHKTPEYKVEKLGAPRTSTKIKLPRNFTVPHSEDDIQIPDGDGPIVLTMELIDKCRANGSFTNATMRAFGITYKPKSGWVDSLVGKTFSRQDYKAALEGRFIYKSGPLNKTSSQLTITTNEN